MNVCKLAKPFFVVKWSTTPPLKRQEELSANPPLRRNLVPSQHQFSRKGDESNSVVPGAGVMTVLQREAIWHRKIPTETTVSVGLKTRIASNDAGIAQVITDVSNSLRTHPSHVSKAPGGTGR